MKKIISLLLSAVLMLGAVSPVLAKDSTAEALRLKWYNNLTGGDYAEGDAEIQAKVDNAAKNAQTRWDSMVKNPTEVIWEDAPLDYELTGEGMNLTFERLRTMTIAYSYKTSPLYHNQDLKKDILKALRFLNDEVYYDRVNYVRVGAVNWYYWEIGVPKNLVDILVLLYDEMDAGLRDGYISAVRHFMSDDPGLGPFGSGTSTGSNLTWKCMAYAILGIVADEASMIQRAADRVTPVFEYADTGGLADGFYTDGSYIQHYTLAYTGGYGTSTLSDGLQMIWLLDGTPYALDETYKQILLDWSINAFLPILYDGNLMDMVKGREVTRYNARDKVKASGVLGSLFRIADIAEGAERELLLGAVKRNVLTSEDRRKSFINGLPVSDIQRAKAMLDDPAVKKTENAEAAKVFGGMDRVVYNGDGFAYGISMYSSRISAYEAITDDNPKGWFTGFGMTYLYNGNHDHYSDSYWPTVDPTAHAGTTVSDLELKDSYKGDNNGWRSGQNWAGGTSLDGRYAAAGMILEDFKDQPEDPAMTAKKSWFMFDNKIVALGSDISEPREGQSVKTTVDNRILSGTANILVDGRPQNLEAGAAAVKKYIHVSDDAAQTGYYFPAGGNVMARLDERTGSWNDLSKKPYNPTDPYTDTYCTITAAHGKNPKTGSYAYIVMPEVTETELEAYSQNETVQIVENSGSAASVRCDELGIQAANFWKNETHQSGSITSSGQASVMTCDYGDSFAVSVSDPTQTGTSLEITVDRAVGDLIAKDDRITVIETSPALKLQIDTSRARGRAIEASFRLDGERRPEKAKKIENQKEIEKRNIFCKAGNNQIIVQGNLTGIYPENPSVTPVERNGVTYVPVRFIAEKLGGTVNYDSKTNTVTIVNGEKSASLVLGGESITVDGETVALEPNTIEIDGRSYLPVRVLAEKVFGREVLYRDGLIAVSSDSSDLDDNVFLYYSQMLGE